MSGDPKFLIDSDVFIRAKDIDYPFHVLPIFWQWIEAGNKAGVFFSIDRVRKEISATDIDKPDPLRDWAQSSSLDGLFLQSKPSLVCWPRIAEWTNDRDCFPAAKAKFLDEKSADAWLVSFAMHSPGYVVVTNEVSAPGSKTNIKLPDAALAMGVETTTLRLVMERHAGTNFQFKP